jgi:cytochrome c-type biogenesis protein CcmH/NrfG
MRVSSPIMAFAALVALAPSSAWAQVGSVRGKVVDGEGSAVADATVSVRAAAGRGLTFKSKTKKDGTFLQLTAQTSGPWTVTISKDGYKSWETATPLQVPLGGEAVVLPTVTLWTSNDSRAPVTMTQETAKRVEAERKELDALSAQVDAATGDIEAADMAQQAGDATLATQKLDAAEAAYRALVETNPTIARLHLNLALVLEKKQLWDAAEASYLKAAEINPELIEAYVGAAAMDMNAGQPAKAVELLERALKTHAEDPQLQFLMGLARFNMGDYALASALFEKVRQTDAGNAEPYYYLGVIAVAQNRAAEAVGLLQKYVAMRPTNARNLKVAEDMLAALKKAK